MLQQCLVETAEGLIQLEECLVSDQSGDSVFVLIVVQHGACGRLAVGLQACKDLSTSLCW